MRCALMASVAVLLYAVSAVAPLAQSKPALTPADYEQFESISTEGGRSGLSPDGRWLAYGVNRVSGKNELRITRVGSIEAVKLVAFGAQAAFSSTSEWLAYAIGHSEEEQEKMRTARQPIRRKLGLYNLASNTETIVEGIESFAFDRTGQSIAMKRYAPAPPGGGPPAPPAAPPGGRGGAGADAPAVAPVGTTLIVRDLASGADLTFGHVVEYAWQPSDAGRLLAMTIAADGQIGNGVQLYNAATSVVRALDSAAADYSGLVWRDDSADLVVLRSKTDEKRDGPTHVALAWTSLAQGAERRHTLDPIAGGVLDAAERVVAFRRPSWLQVGRGDGPMVLLGVGEWKEKRSTPGGGRGAAPDAATREEKQPPDEKTGPPAAAAAPGNDDKPDVDVWHWNDARVMARQKVALTEDRRRNLPAVWNLSSNALVKVGKTFDETVSTIRGSSYALVSEFTPYVMDRSIGRPATDLLLVDLATGARTPLRARVTGFATTSLGGKYVLFTEGGHYWTIDLKTKATNNITRAIRTHFADVESDSTAPERPMFGVAGWTSDDEAVVLYDKFDLWRVTPDGRTATRLTNGAPEQIRHRYVRVEPPRAGTPDPVDTERGYVSLFGTISKQAGYGRLTTASGSAASLDRLVWLDKVMGGLAKAEKADVFAYTVQGTDDSPDLFVGGPTLASAAPSTATNPFLSKFAWTRAELIEYSVQAKGRPRTPLQGILHYPVNYDPSRKYPMVVDLYEKLSDNLHRFENPSERDYYNGTSLTQNGYFYFQPDIVFQPREPGVSMLECVAAAVKKVVDMGVIDPARVGVMGHSWGGFDAMYLATHSKIFAAAVAGAGISNLVSNYGNHHWSSGIAETDHIETGQQRMVVPLYEDLPAYIRNSAVFGVSTMTTPLLLMTGDNDGTVHWHQSVELYNIARRAKRNVVMLVYNNEDHGLRTKKNQVDYHRRIRAWFGHYLKGDAAETWMTEGVTALQRDQR